MAERWRKRMIFVVVVVYFGMTPMPANIQITHRVSNVY